MIVNPYNEMISLVDMRIDNIDIKDDKIYINLDQANFCGGGECYILDNPLIIINDIIDIDDAKNYPIRIRLMTDDEIITPRLEDFNQFSFEITEEAYGFGLIHFYGKAMRFIDDSLSLYDCSIDIFYRGELEIKWDDKKLVEA